MRRFSRRDCDFLVLERGRRWTEALARAATGLEELARGGMPAQRSRDRLKRAETLDELEALLAEAPASLVAIECDAVPEEAFLGFLHRPAVERSQAVWVRLGSEGRRPPPFALDWTWTDSAASVASCDRLWRLRRRALNLLPADPADPLSEIFRALPWPEAASTAEPNEPT